MELRQWLFIAGALIILFVVVDAIRRARRARHDALEMARQMGGADMQQAPLQEDDNPELPGGGFRVVRAAGEKDGERIAEPSMASANGLDGMRTTSAGSPRAVAGGAARLASSGEAHPASYAEPVLRADAADSVSWHPRDPAPAEEEEVSAGEQDGKNHRSVGRTGGAASRNGAALLDDDFKSRFLKRITPIQAAKQKKVEDKAPAAGGRKDEIIVVNVISKSEEGFKGYQLLDLVEACGMEMGRMNIFHRHEHGMGEGPVQFSMANAVEPGTFAEGFEDTFIPGVSFFVQLPGPDDSMKAFEYMIETAQCLARNLGGELRDERQSAMTGQTIEHGRQRVREFERRQLSVRG